MANTTNIQILRSYTANTPASLLDGQLAYSSKSGNLFIGANNNVVVIGGKNILDTAQNAYDAANVAQANVNSSIALQAGINQTQNSNITAVNQYAATAYAQANITIGVDATQNTRLNSIETINTNQNTTIGIIQGVDLTQNTNITTANNAAWAAFAAGNTNATNITSVNQYAASAYAQSNVTIGVDATQNTRLNSIETINTNQNTTIGIIQGVDLWQNNQITYVNQFTQSAYDTANAAGTSSYVQAAFDKANTASANTVIIQGANLTQNTRLDGIEGTNLAQNTNITAVNNFAQSAYNTANGANGLASGAYAQGNVTIGVDATQNTRLNSIETINTNQNTTISIIQGVDLGQNATITSVNQFTQSAYNTANSKFSSSGGTITGSVSISGNNDLTVSGNLYVTGTQFVTNTTSFATQDPLLVLGVGNYTSDIVDIGFAGHYNDGANAHTGIVRDSGTKEYYFFKGYTPELDTNNNININDASFRTANVNADYFKGNLVATTAVIGGRDLQAVNDSQNTNTTFVNQYAASAYAQANVTVGVDATQNTQIQGLQGVDLATNSAITIIQGVDTTQNTRLNSIETVDNNQNTAIGIIQGVDLTQNTNITTANNAAWAAFAAGNTNATNITLVNQYAASAYAQGNVTVGVDATQNTNITTANNAAWAAFAAGNTNATNITSVNQYAASAYAQANVTIGVDATQNTRIGSIETINTNQNTTIGIIQGVDLTQNTNIQLAWNTANSSVQNTGAQKIYGTLNIANSTGADSNTTGALVVLGGVGIGEDLYVAANAYVRGSSVLTANDLVTVTHVANYITMNPLSVTVPVVGTSTTYGTYNFGDVTSIQTYGDYNIVANTGFYSVNDGSGAPGHVEYIGFTGVSDFNRIVLNINYTATSGHTQDIDVYNYQTDAWDTFGTYSGSGNWQQFALGVVDSIPYISSGNVTVRNYHVNSGNTQHRTWIDYVALEKSITGGQGPRGATGATGATGPAGANTNTANVLVITNTTTSISNTTGAIVSYGGLGVSGNVYADAVFDNGVRIIVLAQNAYNQANVTVGGLLTANSNITVIQGVDLTQNTNITTANNAAWSAFAAGNTNATNITSVNQYAQSAYAQANVTIGVDATQNTRIGSIETINTNQNTTISIIQGVDLTQNTRLDGIEGTNLTQNTNITAVNQFTQSAYNAANNKLNLSGGTLTGPLVISANSDLTVTGNLVVLGNTFSVGTQTLEVVDPLIILGIGNYTTDIVDIGFAGHYNAGANAHTGLFRDATSKDWYIFQGYTPELTGNNDININHASFDTANLIVKKVTANVVATTVTISGRDQASVDSTQNTNITLVNQYAASAYAQANVTIGVDASQNANIIAVQALANTDYTTLSVISTTTSSNGLYVPVITITANGRVSSISNTAITPIQSYSGSLTSNSIVVTNIASVNSTVIQATTATTAQTAIDVWSTSVYRTAKYIISMTSASNYHVIELLIVQNGTTPYIAQYAEIITGSSLASFDASISGGNFSLLVNPASATSTTYNISRSTISV